MEKEFEKINLTLTKISEDIVELKVGQARIEVSQDLTKEIMDEHIKRTSLAEENIDLLRKEMRQEFRPVKKHVQLVGNLFKFIIAAGSLLLFLNQMNWLKPLVNLFF